MQHDKEFISSLNKQTAFSINSTHFHFLVPTLDTLAGSWIELIKKKKDIPVDEACIKNTFLVKSVLHNMLA